MDQEGNQRETQEAHGARSHWSNTAPPWRDPTGSLGGYRWKPPLTATLGLLCCGQYSPPPCALSLSPAARPAPADSNPSTPPTDLSPPPGTPYITAACGEGLRGSESTQQEQRAHVGKLVPASFKDLRWERPEGSHHAVPPGTTIPRGWCVSLGGSALASAPAAREDGFPHDPASLGPGFERVKNDLVHGLQVGEASAEPPSDAKRALMHTSAALLPRVRPPPPRAGPGPPEGPPKRGP
jgi:hypothetical protein